MFFLLAAIPAIIIPAVSVIRIILTTEKLHTIYYLFVINLLVTDILNTLKMGFEVILVCLYLFGINVDSTVSFVIFTILCIPCIYSSTSLIYQPIAIDRAVAIAFPYRHKSIMTYKRAYVMLTLTWIISSIISFVIYLPESFIFLGSFGIYTPMEKPIRRVILFVSFLY